MRMSPSPSAPIPRSPVPPQILLTSLRAEPGQTKKLEIGFNNRYLMEALRYAPADKVKIELNTGVSPAIMSPVEGEENFLYMVLPVRLKSAE